MRDSRSAENYLLREPLIWKALVLDWYMFCLISEASNLLKREPIMIWKVPLKSSAWHRGIDSSLEWKLFVSSILSPGASDAGLPSSPRNTRWFHTAKAIMGWRSSLWVQVTSVWLELALLGRLLTFPRLIVGFLTQCRRESRGWSAMSFPFLRVDGYHVRSRSGIVSLPRESESRWNWSWRYARAGIDCHSLP